jgi:purine-nucleoside phosphorylase
LRFKLGKADDTAKTAGLSGPLVMNDWASFDTLREQVRQAPAATALVLGSGLGAAAQELCRSCSVPFAEVPGLAGPSVAGHAGRLSLGEWAGQRVLVFEGRLHFYEGHSWEDVVRPVRIAEALGARRLVVTNAAGGIHTALGPGSLMAIRDHMDWTRPSSWRPLAADRSTPRPSPYSQRLLGLVRQAADDLGIRLHVGTYAAVTGPCYETPAEIRALKLLGADAVGMSTAAEAQAAADAGMECAGLSCLTNRAAGLGPGPLQHDEVLSTAASLSGRLAELLAGFLKML